MDKHAQLWNQYQHLTDEIKSADTQNFQILGVVITAIVAILNAGFANDEPVARFWMFLSAYAITYPARRLYAGNQARVWRIATYMRVFIEPEFDHVRWQTRLYDRSRISSTREFRGMLSSRLVSYELRIFATLNVVVAIVLISGSLMGASTALALRVGAWTAMETNPVVLWVIGLAAITLSTGSYLVTTSRLQHEIQRHGKVETTHFESWAAVKESESTASA